MSYKAILIIFLLLASIELVYSKPTESIRKRVYRVFEELRDIESLGYNISKQVKELNKVIEIINNIESGRGRNINDADKILSKLETSIPKIREEAIREKNLREVLTVTVIIAVIATIVLLAIYFPRIIWKVWVRSKRKWRVKKA